MAAPKPRARRAPHQFGLLQRVDRRPVADEVADVVAHLEQLLNMKQGYGSFNPELGLSISDTMWSSRPMASLGQHIREAIERFEPRLGQVRVEPLPPDEHLCPEFRITGTIGSEVVRIGLSLHTVYCSVHIIRE